MLKELKNERRTWYQQGPYKMTTSHEKRHEMRKTCYGKEDSKFNQAQAQRGVKTTQRLSRYVNLFEY